MQLCKIWYGLYGDQHIITQLDVSQIVGWTNIYLFSRVTFYVYKVTPSLNSFFSCVQVIQRCSIFYSVCFIRLGGKNELGKNVLRRKKAILMLLQWNFLRCPALLLNNIKHSLTTILLKKSNFLPFNQLIALFAYLKIFYMYN